MTDIKLDLDGLHAVCVDLQNISCAFYDAKVISSSVGDAVGQPILANRVRDFESSWSIRRDHINQAMKTIAAAVSAIETTFREADTDLSSALTG